ncbi:response regulator transcription factor, partial [bacterium]|nr:response regulator transcription factor [bacterium]
IWDTSHSALNKNVLIIDHVKMFRISLASMLNANDYKVVGEVWSPDESTIIETLLLKAPSIITIDYNMPELSCGHLIKRIKTTAPDAKIVIISEELSSEEISAMLRAGANDFVTKPVQQIKLLAVLKGL